MKTVGASLAAHLAGEVTTLATLWKITRADAAVYGFTDAAADITYSGVIYKADTGHTPSAIKTNSALAVDNLDIVSVLDSSTITAQDIAAGRWDFAAVELMLVNYADIGMGVLQLRKGTLGRITTQRGQFSAELRGLTQALQQTMGDAYTAACRANLGDAQCSITLASYTVSGTVTSVTDNRQFADTSLAQAAGYFDGGLVTWTAGGNAGLAMEVKTYTTGAVVLQLPMPGAVAIGDTYTINAGCDKTRATCRDRFSNVVNFRGFPDIPGNDKVLATA